MSLTGTQQVTANAYNATYAAQQDFLNTLAQMKQLAQAVDDSRVHLVTAGYIADSGTAWSNSLNMWGEQFAMIMKDTSDMADMLGTTVNLIKQNEGRNADLVNGLVNKLNSDIMTTLP